MRKLMELANLGQSVWLDYIQRAFILSGDMSSLIESGLRGMTSNPTIFEQAIRNSHDYDQEIDDRAKMGKSDEEIYEALAVDDIRRAADLMRSVYDATEGGDGYISLEVNPRLAYDTERTYFEAKRLWEWVDRPNLMIKIPATEAGIPAISDALAQGININVTLIFSLERYQEVINAYFAGLERRMRSGAPIQHLASVASFFVSRLDTKVDKELTEISNSDNSNAELARKLMGRAAVSNAKLAYSVFRSNFGSSRFISLQNNGARLQRPLWASTSTKNPNYSDILYVQELIGQDTVNTLPRSTLDAFLDHGEPRLTIEDNLDQAQETIQSLKHLGISMQQVTKDLEDEGVTAFSRSYDSLIESINHKR